MLAQQASYEAGPDQRKTVQCINNLLNPDLDGDGGMITGDRGYTRKV